MAKMPKILYSVTTLVIAFVASQVLSQLQCPSIQCPDDNGSGDAVFLPDPTNCSRYYICSNNFAICQECPYPLVWDPTLDSCNQLAAYPCEATTTTGSPSVSTSSTIPSTTPGPTTTERTTTLSTTIQSTTTQATTTQATTTQATTTQATTTQATTTQATTTQATTTQATTTQATTTQSTTTQATTTQPTTTQPTTTQATTTQPTTTQATTTQATTTQPTTTQATTTQATTTQPSTTQPTTTQPTTPKNDCPHIIIPGKVGTWGEGLYTCQTLALELTTVDSIEEYQCILNLISNENKTMNYWTSGTDLQEEGSFVWDTTGEPITVFYPEGNDQPDHGSGIEDCVSLVYSEDGIIPSHQMNDDDCQNKYAFICK